MSQRTTLFYHSDIAEPYELYAHRQQTQPLFWDEQNQIWAIYSYDACQQLLTHPALLIPPQATDTVTWLNPTVVAVLANLARLSNPPDHQWARQASLSLFGTMQPVNIPDLMAGLLPLLSRSIEVDWVELVGKKLPVLAILTGLQFSSADSAVVLAHIEVLPKLMLPHKSEMQCMTINKAVAVLYPLIGQHIMNTRALRDLLTTSARQSVTLVQLISNLLGLLIQSYDAGRGLLSNALVQALNHPPKQAYNQSGFQYLRQVVLETLRFDPPIHNTRRVLNQDVVICGTSLQKGQSVLLVLAAANRDTSLFSHPDQFDPYRPNNDQLLTFGAGLHACLARHVSIDQTAQALTSLFDRYPTVRLSARPLTYEPLINARLLQQLWIINQ